MKGCQNFCSYCIVPYKRQYLWSLPIKEAVDTVNQAVKDGYKEVIITGVNLDQYHYGFSKLIERLLKETNIVVFFNTTNPLNPLIRLLFNQVCVYLMYTNMA